MQATILEKWGKKPFLIAGPCSAETEEQVLETAVRLKNTGKNNRSRQETPFRTRMYIIGVP